MRFLRENEVGHVPARVWPHCVPVTCTRSDSREFLLPFVRHRGGGHLLTEIPTSIIRWAELGARWGIEAAPTRLSASDQQLTKARVEPATSAILAHSFDLTART
ncbi:hypothetical protein R1flu_004082 [Riccia fluitans]|uniref:Uncharacterized protein n=1 Tax=Riccia fluitans TaxID=41844 RepID=A0ABD1YPU9_9MARC